MTKIRSFTQFLKFYIFKPSFILQTALYAVIYSLLVLILVNFKVLINIFTNFSDFFTALRLSTSYILSYFITMSIIDIVFLFITAVLIGFNIQIIKVKIKNIARQGNLRLVYGIGIISIAGSGCLSCGFSILSVLGLGAVGIFLPFGGIELPIISITILSVSLYYNTKTIYLSCKI